MDGNYQNKKHKILEILKSWVNKVIEQKSWNEFKDLHIDEIDNDFNNKSEWIPSSIFVFKLITSFIDFSKYDLILAIPLSCKNIQSKSDYDKLEFFNDELDLTPPSFYLFPKDKDNYKRTIKNAMYLEKLSKKEKIDVFYNEVQEGREFYRTLYLTR